jgi:hypothetical protein
MKAVLKYVLLGALSCSCATGEPHALQKSLVHVPFTYLESVLLLFHSMCFFSKLTAAIKGAPAERLQSSQWQ